MTPRRVGANLLWLVPGVVGGSEEYTVRLLESFARLGHDDLELTLFVNAALPRVHTALVDEFPTVVAPLSGGSKAWRVAGESTWLARQARAEGLELVHHLGGTMPVVRSLPGMVTIHDLQPFANPQRFSVVKRGYLGLTVPMSVRRAVVVVVLTQFTRLDVAGRIGIDPARILLVPPAIDPPGPVDAAAVGRVRESLGLGDRPYFLYPAITYAHKNHRLLVEAFALVARDHPEPMLVLTGGEADAEAEVRAAIEERGLSDRVVRTGRIPRVQLDALLGSAVALTFPSLYEGFGIPTLEAMSRGLPVIASSVTALPEVVGDAGVLVDPDDVEGWAAAMSTLLADPSARARLAGLGTARAAGFSWEASAQALATAYRTAFDRLGERRRREERAR